MTLFAASRINPSEEINSVYTTSAPFSLHKARKGGSLTSSIGANNRGKSGSSIVSIFTKLDYFFCKISVFISQSPKLMNSKTN